MNDDDVAWHYYDAFGEQIREGDTVEHRAYTQQAVVSATVDGVATTGSNHQTLENEIDPDYEGVVHGTLIFSRSGSDTLYVDPLPVIS